MNEAELQQLVATIGDEILARVAGADSPDRFAAPVAPRPGAGTFSAGYAAEGRAGPSLGARPVDRAVASLIDHTILHPGATEDDVRQVCREALHYGFAAVCVNPWWAAAVSAELRGSGVETCVVVGFPFGASATPVKMAETELAIRVGAGEIDMVMNAGAMRSGNYGAVESDIRSVAEVAHRNGAIVKVILETVLLNDEEKAIGCALAKRAGADFVKTSTGFGGGGATVADVALMRAVVGPELGVKASGGIRNLESLLRMTEAGATRIGASASVAIMQEAGV